MDAGLAGGDDGPQPRQRACRDRAARTLAGNAVPRSGIPDTSRIACSGPDSDSRSKGWCGTPGQQRAVAVVTKDHQPAKLPRPFSKWNGRTDSASSNRPAQHASDDSRRQPPSPARYSSTNPRSAARDFAAAASATHPAHAQRSRSWADSGGKITERTKLDGNGPICVSRDTGPLNATSPAHCHPGHARNAYSQLDGYLRAACRPAATVRDGIRGSRRLPLRPRRSSCIGHHSQG